MESIPLEKTSKKKSFFYVIVTSEMGQKTFLIFEEIIKNYVSWIIHLIMIIFIIPSEQKTKLSLEKIETSNLFILDLSI